MYYAFQNDHKLYMVLEYVGGGELFYHLRKATRFSEELACFYIAEVILALEFLHSNDIIYRDLKPENILLDSEGHIKITDFGLSKMGVTSVFGKGDGQATKTFCGTPEYLAPEIITGIGHGKAVDWWSVGILLYEMLTGRSPFYSPNRHEMYLNVIKGPLNFPPFISVDAQSLLRDLLHRKPEQRLGSSQYGVTEIKTHPFFRNIKWNLVERKEVRPPFRPIPKEEDQGIDVDIQELDSPPQEDYSLNSVQTANFFPHFSFTSERVSLPRRSNSL